MTDSDEWTQLRTRILGALAQYPDAKLALADALDDQLGEGEHGPARS